MKKIILLLTSFAFTTTPSFSQITEIKYRVHVNGVVKQEVDTGVFGSNSVYRTIKNLEGKANVTTASAGDSILINYWLDRIIPERRGQKVDKYYDPKPIKIKRSIGDENSRVDEDEYRGNFIDEDLFTKVDPLLRRIFKHQARLGVAEDTLANRNKYLKTIKDSLVVLSDTLIYPKRNNSRYNLYRDAYRIVYYKSQEANVLCKKLKSNYELAIDTFQKAQEVKGFDWLPLDSSKYYIKTYKNGDKEMYVEKYNRNTDYIIKLENRQYKRFRFGSWDLGAVTIPFKYRQSFNKNGIAVPDELTADINVGVFIGRSVGWVNYKYRRKGDLKPDTWRFTLGGFISPSRIEIDSTYTSADAKPLSGKRTIGALSMGGGLMVSAYDFRFGVFVGTDYGFGNTANQWNYNRKVWFGLGLGYSLSSLTFSGK